MVAVIVHYVPGRNPLRRIAHRCWQRAKAKQPVASVLEYSLLRVALLASG